AAGLARQFLAAPDRAPAIFVKQFLEWAVEIVDVLQRVVDVSLAQHRFADSQPLGVHFLLHVVSFSLGWRAELKWLPRLSHAFVLCGISGGIPYRNGCLTAAV